MYKVIDVALFLFFGIWIPFVGNFVVVCLFFYSAFVFDIFVYYKVDETPCYLSSGLRFCSIGLLIYFCATTLLFYLKIKAVYFKNWIEQDTEYGT